MVVGLAHEADRRRLYVRLLIPFHVFGFRRGRLMMLTNELVRRGWFLWGALEISFHYFGYSHITSSPNVQTLCQSLN